MRKIDRSIENPLDNILLDLSEKVSPFFKKTGHTPNLITLYSAITATISMYALYNKFFYIFSANWLVAYFFDNLDGFFARKYKMVTKLGDTLDHTKDTIMWVITVIILITKYQIPKHFILGFILIGIFCAKHISCQQVLYKNNDIKESISILCSLCKTPKDIRWTRFFGGGSLYLFIIVLVAFSK